MSHDKRPTDSDSGLSDISADDAHDDTFDVAPRSSSVDPKALTAALMSAEADVDLPRPRVAGSTISNLIALNVGESFSKCVEVDDGQTMAEVRLHLNDWKFKLRQSVYQSMRHAKKHDGRELTLETFHNISSTGRVFVFAVVTRTE